MSIQTQMQIKNNTMDMKNYLNDLYDWEDQVNKKGKKKNKTHTPHVPIRGNVAMEEEREKQRLKKEKEQQIFDFQDKKDNSDKKYKRDANTVQDYYRAWDNYDCDKELDKIEETKKPEPQKPMNPNERGPTAKPMQKMQIKGGKSSGLVDINSMKEKANIFYSNGNYQQAIDLYSECIDLLNTHDQQNTEFKMKCILLSNRAQCHLSMNSYAECIRDCQESVMSNDQHTKSFLRMGVAQRKMGQLKQSFTSLLRAKTLDSKNSNVLKELETTQKIIQKKRKDFKESLIRNNRLTVYESQIIMVKDTQQSNQKPQEKQENKTKQRKRFTNKKVDPSDKYENIINEQEEKQPQNTQQNFQDQFKKQDDEQIENITTQNTIEQNNKQQTMNQQTQDAFDELINKIDQDKIEDKIQEVHQENKKKKIKKQKQKKALFDANGKRRVSFKDNLISPHSKFDQNDESKQIKSCLKKHNSVDLTQQVDIKLKDDNTENQKSEKQHENNNKSQKPKQPKNEVNDEMLEKVQEQQKNQLNTQSLNITNSTDFKKKFLVFKNDLEGQLNFLKKFDPKNLQNIFKTDLDPELFYNIIQLLKHYHQDNTILVKEYLKNFCKVDRIKICIKCLLKREKADLRLLLTQIDDMSISNCYDDFM